MLTLEALFSTLKLYGVVQRLPSNISDSYIVMLYVLDFFASSCSNHSLELKQNKSIRRITGIQRMDRKEKSLAHLGTGLGWGGHKTVSREQCYAEDPDLLLTKVTVIRGFFVFLLKSQGPKQEHLSGLALVAWLPRNKGSGALGGPSVYMYSQRVNLYERNQASIRKGK